MSQRATRFQTAARRRAGTPAPLVLRNGYAQSRPRRARPSGRQPRLVQVGGHVIALFNSDGRLFAVDNRCPHMGFPLDRGSVKDCILTCHWHHARFDLNSGGTFDQWADDARVFPVRVEDGAVMVDVAERGDRRSHFRRRLEDGLERDIPLVIAKSVIALMERAARSAPAAAGRRGVRYSQPPRRLGRRTHHAGLYGEPS